MDYLRSGFKVGIFFIGSCLVLAYFLLHAGQVRVMGGTQEFKLLFSSVGNLKVDSPVTYSGFKVGQVIHIRPLSTDERIKHERDVEVSVRVSKDVVVRKDSVAQILTVGFLGEKIVEVSPGSLDAIPLETTEVLYGEIPQDITMVVEHFSKELDQLLPTIKDTLEKLHSTVSRVDGVVQDIAEERKVQALLEGAQEVTKRINRILEENQDEINQTMGNVEGLTKDLKDQLKMASPKIQTLMDKMSGAVEELDQVLADARELLKSNRPGIDKTMKNLEEASEHAKSFLKILKEEPWRLLSKPRPVRVIKGPKRGFLIYQSDSPHVLEGIKKEKRD